MNKLNFENRVSLSRKSDDLIPVIENLSSSYAKRVEFASKNSHLFTTYSKTSEICGPGFCAIPVAVFAYAYAVFVAIAAEAVGVVCDLGLWDCNFEMAMVDIKVESVFYKNTV